MKYYAIARRENITYGQGVYIDELHIAPINAYGGDMGFYPIFENRETAESYLKNLRNQSLVLIELEVYASNKS